jgi:hypothetical protein
MPNLKLSTNRSKSIKSNLEQTSLALKVQLRGGGPERASLTAKIPRSEGFH